MKILVILVTIFLTALIVGHCLEQQKIICENEPGSITCLEATIKILQADYGRTDSSKCPKWNVHFWKTDCTVDLTDYVKGFCQSKQQCEISPSNDVSGDPCKGFYKYLNVSYECLSPVAATPKPMVPSTLPTQRTTDVIAANREKGQSKTCSCPCDRMGSNPWSFLSQSNLTYDEVKALLQPRLNLLVEAISVDKSSTNRKIRTRISARDNRLSSASMGYLGAAFLSLAIILLAYDDMRRLLVKFLLL